MQNTNKGYITIIIGCFTMFILVSILSFQNKLIVLDQIIINWFTERSSSFVVQLMEGITKVGSGEVILLLTIVIGFSLMLKKMWGHAIFLFTLTFGGIALNFFLKLLFQRERPGEMSVIEVFGYSLEIASYSFPSGHTMRSVILFSFLIYLSYYLIKNHTTKTTVTLLLSFIIITIALSRIIIGAHFPSDIFAAITVSISWFYICLITLRIVLKGKVLYY